VLGCLSAVGVCGGRRLDYGQPLETLPGSSSSTRQFMRNEKNDSHAAHSVAAMLARESTTALLLPLVDDCVRAMLPDSCDGEEASPAYCFLGLGRGTEQGGGNFAFAGINTRRDCSK